MLHGGDDDFVAGLDVPAAIGIGHQVDAFGGAAHEDDFAPGGRIQKALHLGAGFFIMARGALAQLVHARKRQLERDDHQDHARRGEKPVERNAQRALEEKESHADGDGNAE